MGEEGDEKKEWRQGRPAGRGREWGDAEGQGPSLMEAAALGPSLLLAESIACEGRGRGARDPRTAPSRAGRRLRRSAGAAPAPPSLPPSRDPKSRFGGWVLPPPPPQSPRRTANRDGYGARVSAEGRRVCAPKTVVPPHKAAPPGPSSGYLLPPRPT